MMPVNHFLKNYVQEVCLNILNESFLVEMIISHATLSTTMENYRIKPWCMCCMLRFCVPLVASVKYLNVMREFLTSRSCMVAFFFSKC